MKKLTNKQKYTFISLIFVAVILASVSIFILCCNISNNNQDVSKTYKITFNKQGGTGGTSYVMAIMNSDMPEASAPTKNGYNFYGYYSKVNGFGIQYYDEQMNSLLKWDNKKDATLYAYWIKNEETFTVLLDKQGGTGGSYSVKAIYDQAMPTASMPTRKDYTFGGFYSEPNGKGTAYYASNMASLRAWNKKSDATLYAYWISNYNAITIEIYNYSQYFDISVSYNSTTSITNNYCQGNITYRVTLKQGYSIGTDTSVSFWFRYGVTMTGVSFKWINSGLGATATSSNTSIYVTDISNTTAVPYSVSGKIYLKVL